MANLKKFEDMLERLVNEDREGAEELFHEIVVEKSREIYENLLEEEEEEEEEVEEASDENDDDDLDEDFNLDEFEVEADDDMGGDKTDDMMGDIEMGMDGDEDDDEMGMDMDMDSDDEEIEDRVVDLEDALDELKAEFEKMMADDEEDDMGDEEDDMGDEEDDMGDEEDDMGDEEDDEDEAEKEEFAFEADDDDDDETDDMEEGYKNDIDLMREYVEKVAMPKGDDNKAKSPVAKENDMGGDAGNLVQGGEETGGKVASPKEEDMGNVNVPGGKASKSMSKQSVKKGGDEAQNKKSTLGS